MFVRDRSSGHYLGAGWCWSPDIADALVLDEPVARALIDRFACEPGAFELADADGEAGDLAVA